MELKKIIELFLRLSRQLISWKSMLVETAFNSKNFFWPAGLHLWEKLQLVTRTTQPTTLYTAASRALFPWRRPWPRIRDGGEARHSTATHIRWGRFKWYDVCLKLSHTTSKFATCILGNTRKHSEPSRKQVRTCSQNVCFVSTYVWHSFFKTDVAPYQSARG